MVADPARGMDPRLYQIAVLAGLLGYGLLALDLELRPGVVLACPAATLTAQYLLTRALGLPRFDARSPLISGLSLALLLRTDTVLLAPAGAAIAIAGKFLIRYRGKHLFNPTNLALTTLLIASDRVWVSPGQWGQTAVLAAALACLGILVLARARRSDVTVAFLCAYAAILIGRALWLGDPLALPLHDLQSGALVIFAFFMISDPRSTPDTRLGRVLFAAAVAAMGAALRFGAHEPQGLLFALAACAPLVPLLDRLLPGTRYEWGTGAGSAPARTAGPSSSTQPARRTS